jgi:ribosome modulation factor
MPRDDQIEAAWQAFLARLPDRRELTPYQVERTRQIFVAGWLARDRAEG